MAVCATQSHADETCNIRSGPGSYRRSKSTFDDAVLCISFDFRCIDVVSMFLFAWATTTITFSSLETSIVMGTFLGVIFIPLAYGLYLAGKKDLMVAEQVEVKKAGPAAARDGPGLSILVGKAKEILQQAIADPLTYLANWGRLYSLWPVHLETACCSIEFGAVSGPRFDAERYGILEAFGSLRQCDLVVVHGTVTRKMAPRLRWILRPDARAKVVHRYGSMQHHWRRLFRFLQCTSRSRSGSSCGRVCSWVPPKTRRVDPRLRIAAGQNS